MNHPNDDTVPQLDQDRWGKMKSMCLSDLLDLHADMQERHVQTLTKLEVACRVLPGNEAHHTALFLRCLTSTLIESFNLIGQMRTVRHATNGEVQRPEDLSARVSGIEELLKAVEKILKSLEKIECEVMGRTPQTWDECLLSIRFLSEMMQDGYDFPSTYITRILADCAKVFGKSPAASACVH